ncbi:hypothetical protein N5D48_21595 [Pseudomonas sp. GD03858]|uniref:hypothetical protein n=2 Tax=Pseudomonas TaxID=286 RepID=UPI00244A194B|nr:MULTISPECIES: hypothetical protein [unclassified Pseudomonas]MDH0650170.1 hypothetical protein [Pseudomonas sp. GD03867]MDH0665005.1 hypothetical protein [Pseudomonas sp. GD03858]
MNYWVGMRRHFELEALDSSDIVLISFDTQLSCALGRSMAVTCPKCGSDKTQKRNTGTKVAAGVGAVAGGVGAVAGGGEGAAMGAAIGSALFPGVGTVVGGVIGFLGGLTAGAAVGAAAGKVVDETILDNHLCNNCDHTFSI